MSCASGPNIISDGLVLNLDAANKMSTRGRRNVLDWSGWVVGTGAVSGYGANGDGNSLLLAADPWGNQNIVWQSLGNDVTSDADGGWNTSSFAVDRTKMYRYSTWIKRKVLGNGSYYFGCLANTVNTRSDGILNDNPYFMSGGWGLSVDVWYLLVGHVWPSESGVGANHVESGIYTVAGGKIGSITYDFNWTPTTTVSNHRSYLYYSTDSTTNQQWYQPRVDVIDGYQPSISDLLNNVGNIIDTIPTTPVTMLGDTNFSTDSGGYFNFNGSTSYIDGGAPAGILSIGGTSMITVNAWVYFTAYGGSSAYAVITCKGMPWTWLLENPSNTFRFRVSAGGVDTNIADVATHALNQWYMVTGTYDGTTMKIYVNGILKNSKAQTGALGSSGTSLKVGCYTPTTYNITGRIAKVQVHNTVLTASEVLQNFNALRSRFGI